MSKGGFAPVPAEDDGEGAPHPPWRARQLKLGLYILAWYVSSVTLTLYNKWLFTVYGLHFPLLFTSLHFAMKAVCARIAMHFAGEPIAPLMSLRAIARVAPAGVATIADVALSNLSFMYITVTYYTIVKSSVPVWILCFSVCFGLQRCRADLLLVLLTIACGIGLASADFLPSEGAPAPSAADVAGASAGVLACLTHADLEDLAEDKPIMALSLLRAFGTSAVRSVSERHNASAKGGEKPTAAGKRNAAAEKQEVGVFVRNKMKAQAAAKAASGGGGGGSGGGGSGGGSGSGGGGAAAASISEGAAARIAASQLCSAA